MKKAFTLICCFFVGIMVHAQHQEAKNALSARLLLPNYQLPLTEKFAFDDFTYGVQLEYSRYVAKHLNLALPLTFAGVDYPLDAGGTAVESGAYLDLDLLLQLNFFEPGRTVNPSVYAGGGINYEGLEKLNTYLPFGAQVDVRLVNNTYLSFKGEYRKGFRKDRDNLQLGLGLKFLLGGGAKNAKPPVEDRDGDGIVDAQDQCPDQAGLKTLNGCPDADGDGISDLQDECPTAAGLPAYNGCPDSDQDGIPDKNDNCPTEAGPEANQGCPYGDRDGDGVLDPNDDCPDIAGLPALRGCPDRDGDGVSDNIDACPNVPGPPATQGCPDTDRDGVMDSQDACPTTPGPASNNGCPDISDADRNILKAAEQAVQFETNSALLKAASMPILDQIGSLMRKYPDYKLTIHGHTDGIGSAMANQTLSVNRAKACFDYLVSKGINPTRMEYAGFGESRPIADNNTAAGRELNRRVEFNIVPN